MVNLLKFEEVALKFFARAKHCSTPVWLLNEDIATEGVNITEVSVDSRLYNLDR